MAAGAGEFLVPRAIGGDMGGGMSSATVGSPGDGTLPFAAAEYLCPQVVDRHRFHARVLPWRANGGESVYTYTALRDVMYTDFLSACRTVYSAAACCLKKRTMGLDSSYLVFHNPN